MGVFIDLTNKRFGKLVVLGRAQEDKTKNVKNISWICKCDCGKITTVSGDNLKRGFTRSCGCIRKKENKNEANI